MTRTTRLPAGDSFQSSSDPRPILVLDASERIDELRIHWPGESPEILHDLDLHGVSTLRIRQGSAGMPGHVVHGEF